MLTQNSTLEDRVRYDCPPLQFMRCNDCRPCNDTEKECRSMRKLAARCIDTIGNDTDNVSASFRTCIFIYHIPHSLYGVLFIDLLPTRSQERGVFGVRSIPVAILP